MKIKSTKGLTNVDHNFPEVGIKKIDENGIVDIEHDYTASKLIEMDEWESAEANDDSEEKKALLEAIEEMPLEDLIDMAKETGVKGWEKFKANEKALRSFLKKRI